MENTCKKCNETKDISLFVKNKTQPNGVENRCKNCKNSYIKKWNLKDPDKTKETRSISFKKWYDKNKDLIKENKKLQYIESSQKIKQRSIEYYNCHKEEKKIYKKKYDKENIYKVSVWQKNKNKKYVENLSPVYLSNILKKSGFEKKQITNELIELKSIIIKTKRLCKTSQI